MANPILNNLAIKKPAIHKLADTDILNPKEYQVERLLEEEYFNKYIKQDKADVLAPTTEAERARIEELIQKRIKKGEEPELLNRYLDNMSKLRFISEERYQAAKDIYDYEINMQERACENDGKQGYMLTQYEAALCHYRKLFTELGIEDIVIGKEKIHTEASAVIRANGAFKILIEEADTIRKDMTRQAYMKSIREDMQALMIQQGVSEKSAKLLTRQLIKLLS